jgi:hypothetical protein
VSVLPNDSPLLESALYYAALGWSVVPTHKIMRLSDGAATCTCPSGVSCISKGKHPAVAWMRYQQTAASMEQIREWFEGVFTGYGVGIVTGAVSDIFVIDIDEGPGKPGGDTIRDLQMLYGDLPFTVQARTGGGGRHLIFRHPHDVWITTARNTLGPGVDTRGDGGFIVAAPSLHESGRFYLWDELAHIRTTAIAEAPAWVIELTEGSPPDPTGARRPATGTGEIIRDVWGKVIDGRERHMIGIICGVIATMARENGGLPTVEAILAEAWPTYERTTRARGASLEADGRGMTLMRQRAGHMLRRALSGKWRINASRESRPGGPETEPDPEKPTRPLILHLEDMENLPPPEWLVKDLFPAGGLIVPYGPPKGGKTFIVLSLCLHVADGRDWFGHPVKRGGVVYIAGEGIGGLGIRTRAMRAHYGIPVNIPFWIVRRAFNLTTATAAADLTKLIRDTVLDEPIAMVVVDTLARAMPGAEENSARDVGLVIAACADVQDNLACAVIAIHHQGKEESRGMRGTTAIKGAVDASFRITKNGEHVTMTNEDQKDAETAPEMIFQMIKVMVGLTRNALVPTMGEAFHPEMKRPRTPPSGMALTALTVLQNLIAGPESAVLPPLSHLPNSGMRGVHHETWRREFYQKLPGETAGKRRLAFWRASQKLEQLHFVGISDPWVWLI